MSARLVRTARWPAVLGAAFALAALAAACSGDGGSGDADAPSQSGISVAGVGTASGEPDIAVISLGVEALVDSVAAARDEAARAIAAVAAELREAGVADADVRTSSFSINPRYDYRSDRQELVGYRVANTISVTARDLNGVGALLDRAAAAGGDATRVDSVTFRVEDTAALERQARVNAIADAAAKADLYAEQLGVSRGRVSGVQEVDFAPYPIAEARVQFAAADAASAPTQLFPGEYEVTARVGVTFAIE